MRAAFMTLGCKVNQFETETMEGLFRARGYEVVPFEERAEVYVINTCSVTHLSDRKSRQLIRRAARTNPSACIAVTGCYAQVAPEEIRALEGVRVVIGTKERARIVDYVEEALRADTGAIGTITDIMQARVFEDIPLHALPHRTRAFLKIEDGCQNFCTFCIIPYARGPVKSRELSAVAREMKLLTEAGFHEVVLTGIHLGAYGIDLRDRPTLADACRTALAEEDLRRLRLGSLESVELSAELLELMRTEPRFAAHLHLPLQAGSDNVLRAMNRHYDTAAFATLLEDVRRAVPGVAISTDIIVGFPGETEEDFAAGLDFVRAMGFARMHVFPYSPRKGTPAARRSDQVLPMLRKERAARMQALADELAEEYHRAALGSVADVLFETSADGVTDGLTETYIRVYTDAPVTRGEIAPLRLTHLYRDGVWGEPTAK
ncbi:tRNA (N(6)-L-threonylcarbamoyladenosine(37)-C(2))-methylthiotransferase MtaB [Selenomonas timonae]|uniref:Threonylcarbamoyladenosine tRNA methylthiotransferase MtaB n=1 Tax=Selenomonas timonae TaxID=2754044 RepID=A0A7G7VLQ5_9FIRM|nr:tRNA (N(6)-L-threonylcarbamoyladenosine(37)-C(2))-methylthiotransferase MtaB [Selenomonas timonae]QNH55048.1 tRNA (N(6)-L-threonylcarbamoyladenosine(37)-C(2))-methylthiotransferase MtaB [Selenomonas timonae]